MKNKFFVISSVSFLFCVFLVLIICNYDSKEVYGTNTKNLVLESLPKKTPEKKAESSSPNILAKSYYLLDLDTLYPMVDKNANSKLPIASTTKIATALVVLENYPDKLNDEVVIDYKYTTIEGSGIQLKAGEKITVESLLNGLLIMSGNDTAYALANHFGGKTNFVFEMNEKVKQIGAYNTSYKDPSGLDDEGYSTAEDLAIISAYALRNQKFREIVQTPEKTVYSTNGMIAHELKNSNRMLREEESYYFPYAKGVKTGFTYAAGHVLVSFAQKDGHGIVGVVLNTFEDTNVASAKESKKLLEWGFNNWTW